MSNPSKIVGGLTLAAAVVLARKLTRTWGSKGDEAASALPGDLLVPDAAVTSTRAITIDATPGEVWPWIQQIGWDRGGFYAYESLENAFGLDIHNAAEVAPSWQELEIGDEVHLAEGVSLQVFQLEAEHHLVLLGDPKPGSTHRGEPSFRFSWAFVLSELPAADGPGRTRLMVRERYAPLNAAGRIAVEAIQPASFVMTQKMLRGIRDRAEGTFVAG